MWNEKYAAWFATGWLAVCFLSWGVEKMRSWLRHQKPCIRCGGDGYEDPKRFLN